jgi:DNA invertase Pin-like site-specific DNA recombinase
MRYMLTWFSNYFLEQHTTKVLAGMKKAKEFGTKSGKAIGKPRKADYNLIRQKSADGMSISQIAKELSVSKSSVSNAIKNKTVS